MRGSAPQWKKEEEGSQDEGVSLGEHTGVGSREGAPGKEQGQLHEQKSRVNLPGGRKRGLLGRSRKVGWDREGRSGGNRIWW